MFMKVSFGAKPWIYPQPVLMIGTYDENGVANLMNAAWGGIGDTEEIRICLSSNHKTMKNILLKKVFTVSMATKKTVSECDYFGIASGNTEKDKVVKAGFHSHCCENIDAPYFDELPLTFECSLISYDEESGSLRARILNVFADEAILTDGHIDPKKLEPITFDPINNEYLLLGGSVGKAFAIGKKFFQ